MEVQEEQLQDREKLSEFLCLGVCSSKDVTSRMGFLFGRFIYSVPRNDFLGC